MSMRLFLLSIIPCLLTYVVAQPAESETVTVPAIEGMKLVWHDEFSQNGRPDPEKWSFEEGFSRNEELQWYQADNAFVEDGLLVIEGRRETIENPHHRLTSKDWRFYRPEAHYTSACLITRGLAEWQYGRFEIRARFPTRQGLWPAIWFLGTEGHWPRSGEIDLLEYYQDSIWANACWGHEKHGHQTWDSSSTPMGKIGDENWSQDFHLWRMDWDPESIRLYLDDRLLNTIDLTEALNPEGTSPAAPFQQAHYLLLNLAIGSSGGDPSELDFPQRYEIDYVRVYQQQED